MAYILNIGENACLVRISVMEYKHNNLDRSFF